MHEAPPAGIPVSAHVVPPPSTVSPQARAFLSQRVSGAGTGLPAVDDLDGWRTHIAQTEQWMAEVMETGARAFPAEVLTYHLSHAPLYEIVPEKLAAEFDDCAIFYLHGGGFVYGAGLLAAYMGMPLAAHAGLRTFAVDYRMPPDHPFPAGLDDAIDAYRSVLERYESSKIVVAGTSAGGGLAASLVLKARNLGLPLPGACVLATPEADLTESGDTFETNIHVDVVISKRLTDTIALYAAGYDLRDPHLSPLFGDFTKGFPPTILTSGTRDVFLSNTVLMHRALLRAGVEAELHVWEGMPHGGFMGAPEDQEVLAQQADFIRRRLRQAAG
jgi:acetyl esterase/lipase